ncbi:accessory Sec system protein Asp4 [Streptococcus timonensis]|uniref:accessory Sec system protein Asp4 n=1 Tax=Streptococcus timonensis TaxID=1852387 RepID=UPI0039C1439F
MSDHRKDLFYKEVEGRMEELKRRPPEKEKTTRSERINVIFNVVIGLVILFGVLFTLFRVLGGS